MQFIIGYQEHTILGILFLWIFTCFKACSIFYNIKTLLVFLVACDKLYTNHMVRGFTKLRIDAKESKYIRRESHASNNAFPYQA